MIDSLITTTKDKTIVEVVHQIIKTIKYDDHIKSLDLAEERLENIEEFIKSIEEFESKRDTHSIEDFMHEISLYTDNDDNANRDRNAVSLMTIHYAKGTEAKVVFIIGLNEGIFPSIKLNRENDIEEERRIAYVGVTRSMEKLYLTCNVGFSPMSGSQLNVSRFIKDIGHKNLREEESEMISISNADLS
jgi:DNA helicase-2/ATP-dependent DNA helicase PcrA